MKGEKTMRWKKVTAILLAGAMCASMAGCGGGDGKESGGSSDGLVVAIWDTAQEPGLTEMMAQFTEETGIKCEIQVTPWDQYWTMLEAGATGGSLPDVFWMHSNMIDQYADYDMLLDLSDAIEEKEIDMGSFPEELVTLYQDGDGKQVGMPKDMDTTALWYNKTMFDEAGIAYPDSTWTWDMFRDAAQKLTKDDGSQYGAVFKPSANQESYYNLIYDWGGYVISEDGKTSGWDDPKTIEAMQYIEQLNADGSMPDYTTVAENDPIALLQSGKVAMAMLGSWHLSSMADNEYALENLDCAVLPGYEGTSISIFNGLAWSASANTDKPDEAKELITWLGSGEAQKMQADLGVTMSAYEGVSDGFAAYYENFNVQAYLDMQADVVMMPHSKNTTLWDTMSQETLVNAWDGTCSMEEACNQIAQEMNEMLASE